MTSSVSSLTQNSALSYTRHMHDIHNLIQAYSVYIDTLLLGLATTY